MKQERVIELIIGSEKGLNEKEPESVGGVSYDGVSLKTYTSYLLRIREKIADAPSSVRDLENRPDVVNLFYELYLGDYNVWILPDFLQYIYADFVVNAGSAAVRIIQEMAECDVDGVFGSGTRAAVTKWVDDIHEQLNTDPSIDNKLIMEFHEAKLAHYQNLVDKNPDKFQQWHEGWKRRANHVLSELSEYFETDEGTPSAMADEDVPVVESEKETNGWGTASTELQLRGTASTEKQSAADLFESIQSDIKELSDRVGDLENIKARVDALEKSIEGNKEKKRTFGGL